MIISFLGRVLFWLVSLAFVFLLGILIGILARDWLVAQYKRWTGQN